MLVFCLVSESLRFYDQPQTCLGVSPRLQPVNAGIEAKEVSAPLDRYGSTCST